jgi:capsular polysaccharide biosynthesis protein
VATAFDPEAEQEVDFARYGRMLARRWWLVAVGVIAGAVIGYLTSLGGTKVYSATATLYLGQPYNGTTAILTLQTNPSAVSQIANSQAIGAKVAKECNTRVETFHKGISVQKVASSTPTKGIAASVNPLVTVTVQTSKGKVATCAANALAKAAVEGPLADYSREKIRNYSARVANDANDIKRIGAKLEAGGVSGSDVILLTTLLRADQTDLSTYSQALFVAKQVEAPKVIIPARQREVTAASSRNTVLIATLIGLILGILAALLWDRAVPRLSARNGS